MRTTLRFLIRSSVLGLNVAALAALTAAPLYAQEVSCISAASDVDGDGWGWENNQSCRVVEGDDSDSTADPTCQSATSDSDGDGWGWENDQSCRVAGDVTDDADPDTDTGGDSSTPDCVSADSDSDGDGWGWENGQSCLVVAGGDSDTPDDTDSPVSTGNITCESADSDEDGDGWGWENEQSCVVADNTPEEPVDEPDDADNEPVESEIIDIYNAIFTERSADCGDYVNTFDATVIDIQNSLSFNADVEITATDSTCTFTSNSVPNHDFNDESAAFAGGQEGATIAATASVLSVSRTPQFAANPTYITQELKNAVFLNGVRLDILSAGCYQPANPDADDRGEVGIGCRSDAAWLLDPLSTESKFGADIHNAHTQPGGLYHYHGGPNAMFDDNPGSEGSPVIGFAADGFPVYGSYFYDNASGQVRKALSGYSVRAGSRGITSDTNPGGDYTGRYNDDWEYTGAGDLDECNGMTVDGQYGYYVTDTFPWVIKCLQGTPDSSFGGATEDDGAGGGGGPQGPPPAPQG